MSTIDTLNARGKAYGSFATLSATSQAIKDALQDAPRWQGMSDDKKEALGMIATKIARIICGDANHKDSWHDIAGYATLIEQTLDD